MHRRDFLRLLLASPLAMTLDVEQLLWVPRPMIVVPGRLVGGVTLAMVNEVYMRTILPKLVQQFERESPLMDYLSERRRHV